ncbi:MAG: hypothetical protein AB8B73_11195 [Ekhidna sp.]
MNFTKSLYTSLILIFLAIANTSNAQSIGIKFTDKHYIFYDENSNTGSSKLTPEQLRLQLSQLGTEMLRQKEDNQRVLHIINSIYSLVEGREYIWMTVCELECANPQEEKFVNDEDFDYTTLFND